MTLTIEKFDKSYEKVWDDFILEKSINGTFIQTRKFISYHEEGKFEDASLLIKNGEELVGVILACTVRDADKKCFYAHKGTSYGGITISESIYSVSYIDELFRLLEEYFKQEKYDRVFIKVVPSLYAKQDVSLVDYFFYKYNYFSQSELNFYIDLSKADEDSFMSMFSRSKRRDYKYSLKNNFLFKELSSKEEIKQFYKVQIMNCQKLGITPVHSLDDLINLKFNIYDDLIHFYGVFLDDTLVAGSMVFFLGNEVYHTQYLVSDENYQKLFSTDFLIANLIKNAIHNKFSTFSFGICTENYGKYINLGLSRFKEGFGAHYCINYSYCYIPHREDYNK